MVTKLVGNWRRRRNTKTDTHLYSGSGHHPFDQRPICGKAIRYMTTEPIKPWTGSPRSRSGANAALPCTECLINAIGQRDYSK